MSLDAERSQLSNPSAVRCFPELTASFCKAVQADSAGALPITSAVAMLPLATCPPFPQHPDLPLKRETENCVGLFKEGQKDRSARGGGSPQASPMHLLCPLSRCSCGCCNLDSLLCLWTAGTLLLHLRKVSTDLSALAPTDLFASSEEHPRQWQPGQPHQHVRVLF